MRVRLAVTVMCLLVSPAYAQLARPNERRVEVRPCTPERVRYRGPQDAVGRATSVAWSCRRAR